MSRVAGLVHICVCIAGASTTGQVAVSTVALSRSSARPAAIRASRSAVAGAIRTRSASSAWRTWLTAWTSSNTLVFTGCPDSASQVGAPTNRRAVSVGMGTTS